MMDRKGLSFDARRRISSDTHFDSEYPDPTATSGAIADSGRDSEEMDMVSKDKLSASWLTQNDFNFLLRKTPIELVKIRAGGGKLREVSAKSIKFFTPLILFSKEASAKLKSTGHAEKRSRK